MGDWELFTAPTNTLLLVFALRVASLAPSLSRSLCLGVIMVLRENRAETQRAETQRGIVIAMKRTWFKKRNVELSLP